MLTLLTLPLLTLMLLPLTLVLMDDTHVDARVRYEHVEIEISCLGIRWEEHVDCFLSHVLSVPGGINMGHIRVSVTRGGMDKDV